MSAFAPDREPTISVAETSTIRRIEAEGLTKRYGLRTILRSLDLSIAAGECVALYGPNGAGKTTLLRVLSTLTRPAAGSLLINEIDAQRDPTLVRAQIGVLAHQPYVYDSLSARENLQFFGRMYDVANLEVRIEEVLEMVGLHHRATDLVGTFSRGMQQRIALARSVLHQPTVLLLDEPDTGLDPASMQLLRSILVDHCEQGGAILLTTHDIQYGLEVGSRALVLANGQIIIDEPTSELDKSHIESTMGALGA